MEAERWAKAIKFWHDNPVEAVKNWFDVTPTDYQGDIIHATLAPGPDKVSRVSVKSGHGVGKTTTESWMGWVFLVTREMSKVVATAPVRDQLNDVLWPEFSKWHGKMPREMANQWDVSATHIRHKKNALRWFAAARTSNKRENMQGFHEDHIMVLVEEASGVPQMIFEVIEGILSNAEEQDQEAILAMFGNPTIIGGEFYDSFHKNKDLYTRFTISGDDRPLVDPNGGTIYHSPRVTKAYRTNMAKKYGLDTAVYDVRVTGIFPRESDRTVIPMSWAQKSTMIPLPAFDLVVHPITLVMDVARFGGDETVLGVFRGGHCLSLHVWPKTSTTQCVDILEEGYKHGAFGVGSIPVIRVIVDEPGVGGGVIDGARRKDVPITPYAGNASMVDDPDEDQRMFANRRSRDWWNVRRKMEFGQISTPRGVFRNGVYEEDETLVNQLASVEYDYFGEKIKVETKKEMRERLGDAASPDRGDVIVMGAAPFVGIKPTIPLELIGVEDIHPGEERPTANMDF